MTMGRCPLQSLYLNSGEHDLAQSQLEKKLKKKTPYTEVSCSIAPWV